MGPEEFARAARKRLAAIKAHGAEASRRAVHRRHVATLREGSATILMYLAGKLRRRT
jgi:hypothetical protein